MDQKDHIRSLAQSVIDTATADGTMVAVAESCTGGLISAALTDIPGASAVLDRGFITYSYEAKSELLDVDPDIIVDLGAVSAPVAEAMAEGALTHSRADIAVSVTGIAGPGGGTEDKPVGLVWFALARRGSVVHSKHHIFDNRSREGVRNSAVETALQFLLTGLTASVDEDGAP